MKIAFIHDHKFVKIKDQYYTTGGMNNELWSFYLQQVQTLHVFARIIESNKLTSSLSSTSNVFFSFSRFYKSPKDFFFNNRKITSEIDAFLKDKDGVIIRLPSFLGLLAVNVCNKNNLPYLVEVVGSAYDALSNYGDFFGRVLAKYIHNLNKEAILNAPFAIYVTQEFLQSEYPCNNITEAASDVQIIFDENFNISSRIDKIKKNDNKHIVLGQIGNLEVLYKGYEEVFKVLSLLKSEYNDYIFEYRIVGSGNPSKIMKIIAYYKLENEVKLLGKLNKHQVDNFLDNIDIYVNPSYQEGLPRAVIESLSRGCPALTSDIGGTSELIEPLYMHKPGDYKDLYNQLVTLIKDKNEMMRVAMRNYNHSLNYNADLLFNKRRKFYGEFFNKLSSR